LFPDFNAGDDTRGKVNPFAEQKLAMSKKSKLALLPTAGIVGGVGVLVVLLLISKPGNPVTVTLQSYTNGCVVLTLKNQTSVSFNYVEKVERRIDGEWPEIPEGLMPGVRLPANLAPGQQTNLTIPVNPYPLCPWRISVFCSRPPIQANSVRYRAGVWCWNHGLPNVSRKLLRVNKPMQISTPEMAQSEK
jgi:hypothetical protein